MLREYVDTSHVNSKLEAKVRWKCVHDISGRFFTIHFTTMGEKIMMRKIFLLIAVSILFAVPAFSQNTTGTATAAEKPKKSAVFRPTKDQIKQVQGILKTKNFYSGEATGTYNDDTRTGIKTFQKGNRLKETGTLNRATLEKFGVELTEAQKAIPVSESSFATTTSDSKTSASTTSTEGKPKKSAPFKATADQIKAAQKLLKEKSMYSGEENGKLDEATRAGLKKYQEANGLTVTGRLNAALLEKMGIALTGSQKAAAAAASARSTSKN